MARAKRHYSLILLRVLLWMEYLFTGQIHKQLP